MGLRGRKAVSGPDRIYVIYIIFLPTEYIFSQLDSQLTLSIHPIPGLCKLISSPFSELLRTTGYCSISLPENIDLQGIPNIPPLFINCEQYPCRSIKLSQRHCHSWSANYSVGEASPAGSFAMIKVSAVSRIQTTTRGSRPLPALHITTSSDHGRSMAS